MTSALQAEGPEFKSQRVHYHASEVKHLSKFSENAEQFPASTSLTYSTFLDTAGGDCRLISNQLRTGADKGNPTV